MDYHRVVLVELRIARIFNTYKPRMCIDDGRLVSNFVAQALRKEPLTVYGDGMQTRSFEYVPDQYSWWSPCFWSKCKFRSGGSGGGGHLPLNGCRFLSRNNYSGWNKHILSSRRNKRVDVVDIE